MKYMLLLAVLLPGITAKSQNQAALDSINKLLKVTKDGPPKTKLLLDIAWEYADNNPGKAYEYGEQAVKYAASINDTVGEANGNSDIGVFYEYQGDYPKALEQYKKALAVWERTNNEKGKGTALTNIANLYNHTNDYANALKFYQQALKLHEKIGNKKGAGATLSNMGMIFKQMGDWKNAMDHYRRSLQHLDKEKHQKFVANAMVNIGEVFSETKQYDSALYYSRKAYELYLPANDKKGQSLALTNIGVLYKKTGKYDLALENYKKVLDLQKEIEDKKEIANTYENMGEVYLILKNEELALSCFKNALAIAEVTGNRLIRQNCYKALTDLYAARKDFSNAFIMHQKYTALKDSLLNEKVTSQITEANVKYQTERKDRELLLKDTELERQQAESKQKATQRNAFIGGFILMFLLGLVTLRGYHQKKKANVEITMQKEIIEEKNKEVNDSITYARRIQNAILPPARVVNALLPDSFVLFRPKDIVSGDFYWMERTESQVLFAAVDCTGHGVPGAMVSVVGHNCLTRTVKEFGIQQPAAILDKLTVLVEETFEKSENEVKDGMDISLCGLSYMSGKPVLDWAGAFNPLWVVRDEKIIELKADKQPIGRFDNRKPYHNHSMELSKGDTIYIFTDGFADQFGGEKGKKFKYRQLEELLLSIHKQPMNIQKDILERAFVKWKGNLEQVDDVLVIGVRV
jgi:serine phosphatase RsbU (regulator of sigma subunit)/Tfp pilus assembly protein PilF